MLIDCCRRFRWIARWIIFAARVENLSKRARRTSLRNGTAAIETIEHCLAAARGLGGISGARTKRAYAHYAEQVKKEAASA